MRVFLVIIILLVTGCATDSGGEISGKQLKNGGPVRYERLGTVTRIDTPTELQCGEKRVKWCGVRGKEQSCQCLHIHRAQDQVRRMMGQSGNGIISNP